jgi:hypothetical protein
LSKVPKVQKVSGENMAELTKKFAKIMAEEMTQHDVSLDQIQKQARRGFWKAVLAKLNKENIAKPKGGSWGDSGEVSQYWKRNSEEISAIVTGELEQEFSERKEAEESENKLASTVNQEESEPLFKKTNFITKTEFESALNNLRAEFQGSIQKFQAKTFSRQIDQIVSEIEIIKETVEHMKTAESAFLMNQTDSEGYPILSPTPTTTGKKLTVGRSKLGVTIDPKLMQLLEAQSRVRGISMSRMIDTVVWHYFGQPKLSFQKESEIQNDPYIEESLGE